MNKKIINSLASHITAHWRDLSQEPQLGKLILVKQFINNGPIISNDGKYLNVLKPHNCIPSDLIKYKLSIGFVEKAKDKKFRVNKIFVMMDSMYDSNYMSSQYEEKTAPFSPLFFEKWIYVEELMNL